MADWTETGALTVGGKSLEYRTWGPRPGEAPTIVLLHEGLGCVAQWKSFPEALARATGMGVFAYSRAGYGQSDLADVPRAVSYMTEEAVDVLPHVLDQIGFERGILFGHSDGGSIAAIYAGSVSDPRVRGAVVIAPHFYNEDVGLKSIAAAKIAYQSTNMREKLARYHRDPDHTFTSWSDVWLNPDYKDWDVSDVIDHLRIPVLAVQGRLDQYGTLAQIRDIEERSYAPVELLILDDCGHSPHLEKPELLLEGATDFIKRLERIEAVKVKVA